MLLKFLSLVSTEKHLGKLGGGGGHYYCSMVIRYRDNRI